MSFFSYNSATGVFTVPPGGDGVYYFSTYLLGDAGDIARFNMELNNRVICSTRPDNFHNGADDTIPGSCSAVVNIVAGNVDLLLNIL